jgi:LytS/YehU family sensor histidine kinase
VEAFALAREAELLTLRGQLNPHFLFNSLHSISALAATDGARARDMCIRLADLLRACLRLGNRESIPLPEELALARGYLSVEQVRFGSRLQVEEETGAECQRCTIPALLLQPLVENAVKHGIAGLVEGGRVRLAAGCTKGEVTILLENAVDQDADGGEGLGMGQAHVRKRLEARYGNRASFQASLEPGPDGDLYRVVLRFPCESPRGESPITSSSLA